MDEMATSYDGRYCSVCNSELHQGYFSVLKPSVSITETPSGKVFLVRRRHADSLLQVRARQVCRSRHHFDPDVRMPVGRQGRAVLALLEARRPDGISRRGQQEGV
jgi:hypothetical protein